MLEYVGDLQIVSSMVFSSELGRASVPGLVSWNVVELIVEVTKQE